MKLTFFCNYLNHHQVWVADELSQLLGDNFKFVTTMPFNPEELKGGDDYTLRPYCINSITDFNTAMNYALNSEVCVFGAGSQAFAIERAKRNPTGLSFEVSERWLKKGFINIFSPNFLRWYKNYILFFRKANFHKLCSSGFVKRDDEMLGCYKGKHYKWGYFTNVNSETVSEKIGSSKIRIMWCGRFLKLKHPELAVYMAKSLKSEGYDFELDFYGGGDFESKVKTLVTGLDLDDVVTFHGAVPNDEALEAMRQHDIFIFSSNKEEGWGAVANEALSNGCVLVASKDIGSSPYLIENGQNGFCFKTKDFMSLTDQVRWLLNHPSDLQKIKHNAFNTMKNIWNPKNAAHSLLTLIDDLTKGKESSLNEGPCSKA